MKKYAIINGWKTKPNEPLYVVATSNDLDALKAIAQEHDEVVMTFEVNGQIYYSRDLEGYVKTFKGNADALSNAKEILVKADVELFRLYLKYGEHRLTTEEIIGLDEDEFNVLKGYFFGHKEGYELDATYDEFMTYMADRA